jgi:hypothetical protein
MFQVLARTIPAAASKAPMISTSILSATRAVTFAALVAWPAASLAQTSIIEQPAKPQVKPAAAAAKPATPAPAAKPTVAKPAAPAQPAAAAAKPAAPAKPAAAKPAATPVAAKPVADDEPKLLGQYGEWGAYTATPNGKKVCFALAKPSSSKTNPPGRPRDPAYAFVSTRPAEKVTNEVSIMIGYQLKPGSESSLEVGGARYAMYTQGDGLWIKNAAEEERMVDAMRKAPDVVVKGMSAKGTETSDTFSLKGLAQALDRLAQDCRR